MASPQIRQLGMNLRALGVPLTAIGQKSAIATTQQRSHTSSIFDAISAFNHFTYAARTVGRALDQVYEAAYQGAVVTQTTESWNRFTTSLGQTSSFIAELRLASAGAVPDMQLMSDTMLMASGVSDDLAVAMMDAAPQLMAIARAAQLLNPSLGDTTYFYNSLAMGIKRTSKFRLDNLGITIRATQAYKAYAAQLGKSVLEMTGEEQQMAVLNEVLRVGVSLTDKIGDANTSAVDPYNQVAAAAKNFGNELKTIVAWAVNPAIQIAADIVQGSLRANEWLSLSSSMRGATDTYSEYIDLLTEEVILRGLLSQVQGTLPPGRNVIDEYGQQTYEPISYDTPREMVAAAVARQQNRAMIQAGLNARMTDDALLYMDEFDRAGEQLAGLASLNMAQGLGQDSRDYPSHAAYEEATGAAWAFYESRLALIELESAHPFGDILRGDAASSRSLATRISEANSELEVLQGKLSSLPDYSNLPVVEAQFKAIEDAMNALGPEEGRSRDGEQQMRDLEWAVQSVIEQKDALGDAAGAAGTYRKEIEELQELLHELRIEQGELRQETSASMWDELMGIVSAPEEGAKKRTLARVGDAREILAAQFANVSETDIWVLDAMDMLNAGLEAGTLSPTDYALYLRRMHRRLTGEKDPGMDLFANEAGVATLNAAQGIGQYKPAIYREIEELGLAIDGVVDEEHEIIMAPHDQQEWDYIGTALGTWYNFVQFLDGTHTIDMQFSSANPPPDTGMGGDGKPSEGTSSDGPQPSPTGPTTVPDGKFYMSEGGPIDEEGTYYLHEGEYVLSAQQRDEATRGAKKWSDYEQSLIDSHIIWFGDETNEDLNPTRTIRATRRRPSGVRDPRRSTWGRPETPVRKMAEGGTIDQDGLAYLHKDEYVVPANEARNRGGGPSGASYGNVVNNYYTLNARTERDMKSVSQQFQVMKALGGG